ncbi:LysR substrate-binding domain-containing protein [Curvibacter sp. RS43]|uniref:LysR substrate-binding domain-containing protein n=1 Tax=Curvibacter microcysteis TaxID=3026419 RepID=UPI00235F71AF|nr:LysR substrate-binding domain-containing protein [Curvibacter sp. RS43]MDD0810426.1 LysR substrate-binding domain-containing protein [Curvibacter sp. RS43]
MASPLFQLDQLRTLVAVVEAGSLSAGAPQVFLSASAVSEQLRKLEQQAGQSLLLRSKAGVQPTPAGQRLLAWGRQMLALNDEAYRDLHGVPLAGVLRLGVTDYFRPSELSGLLARLQARYPGVSLQVSVLKSGLIEAAYAAGELDVGITLRVTGAGSARTGQLLRREPLQWLAAPGWRPEPGQALRLLALPDSCSLHQFTVGLLQRRRVPYVVALQASGVAGLQSALAAGLGLACLNASAQAPGVQALAAPHGLPALPQAGFWVLPARSGETEFVRQARTLVLADLA